MTGERASSAWSRLAMGGTPMRSEFRVLDTGVAVAGGPVLYALDSQGFYHLLLPLAAEAHVPMDRRSAGVHILPRVLEERGSSAQFVDVACLRLALNEVFTHLADDMLSELLADATDPVGTCRRVLARWRELIERESITVLSREGLAGLFAELRHLRELVRLNPECLGRWVGPLGGRHDFVAGLTALEVKASLRRDGRFFEVHGVEQLEPPELGKLFLAAAKLEAAEAGGESVPNVIERVMNQGVDSRDLLSRLAAAGYDARDARHYEEIRFRVLEERIYPVEVGFPRITATSFTKGRLPSGVIRIQYTIDLSMEPPFPLDQAAATDLYRRLSSPVT